MSEIQQPRTYHCFLCGAEGSAPTHHAECTARTAGQLWASLPVRAARQWLSMIAKTYPATAGFPGVSGATGTLGTLGLDFAEAVARMRELLKAVDRAAIGDLP